MASTDTNTTSRSVIIGTRRSALALKQAELVLAALCAAHPDVSFEIQARDTMGDVDKVTPLPQLGKGLWTSEFEAKLIAGELDLVVHSAKDMPTTLPSGCALGAVTEREDPRDTVIFKRYSSFSSSSSSSTYPSDDGSQQQQQHRRFGKLVELPEGSIVGTSSLRRMAQLRRRYPGLVFKDLRGNIDTRLKKLDAEDSTYDCIILAAAGLHRMDFGQRISQYLDSKTEGGGILHAVGQGALGIEIREGDERTAGLVRSITHTPTLLAVLAERTLMRKLEGGCSVPIGAETEWEDEGKTLRIRGTVVSLDGTEGVDAELTAPVATAEEAEQLGLKVALELVERGAQKILDAINANRPPATT